MSETYVECLVARKSSFPLRLLKTILMMLTVCFFIFGLASPLMLVVAIVLGVASYFAYMNADIEYEYLYLDKKISVDKRLVKSKRKKAAF